MEGPVVLQGGVDLLLAEALARGNGGLLEQAAARRLTQLPDEDDVAVGVHGQDRDGTGVLVDSVGWGTAAAGNVFIESSPAPAPGDAASPGKTIVRLPDGVDTGNNPADFKVSSKPTPGAANALQ